MTTTATNFAPPKPNRRWFQFSLRSLLLLTAVCAVPLWLWTGYVVPYRAQRRAVAAIEEGGAVVTFAAEPADVPGWLRALVGEEYFVKVTECALWAEATPTVDMEHFEDLKNLRTLRLYGLDMSDAEFEHFKALSNLQTLDLIGNHELTDAGLEDLKGLTNLQTLRVGRTQVTDAGIDDLQKALLKVKIVW